MRRIFGDTSSMKLEIIINVMMSGENGEVSDEDMITMH